MLSPPRHAAPRLLGRGGVGGSPVARWALSGGAHLVRPPPPGGALAAARRSLSASAAAADAGGLSLADESRRLRNVAIIAHVDHGCVSCPCPCLARVRHVWHVDWVLLLPGWSLADLVWRRTRAVAWRLALDGD